MRETGGKVVTVATHYNNWVSAALGLLKLRGTPPVIGICERPEGRWSPVMMFTSVFLNHHRYYHTVYIQEVVFFFIQSKCYHGLQVVTSTSFTHSVEQIKSNEPVGSAVA